MKKILTSLLLTMLTLDGYSSELPIKRNFAATSKQQNYLQFSILSYEKFHFENIIDITAYSKYKRGTSKLQLEYFWFGENYLGFYNASFFDKTHSSCMKAYNGKVFLYFKPFHFPRHIVLLTDIDWVGSDFFEYYNLMKKNPEKIKYVFELKDNNNSSINAFGFECGKRIFYRVLEGTKLWDEL